MNGLVQYIPDVGSLAHVVQTLQLAITPAFLLSAIAALLNVLSARLGRVVDRARRLSDMFDAANEKEQQNMSEELRILNRRIRLASDAIFLCVASAMIVCAVVAVLFIARLIGFPLGDVIALMFILAMILLVIGLSMFMFEVRIATRAIQIRKEFMLINKD